MHVCFLPQASIELCRSQNSGMEPARRHEDGLSSPYQNALCSAFTRKKGRLFPWHASHAPDLPQRCRSARVKLRWRCAALRAPLHFAPFLWPAGRATRGSGKKAFGHPFPQGRGENDLFWHQFSGQSRLKEGLVCPGRCQPSALKKSRFFVLPSEPLYSTNRADWTNMPPEPQHGS